MTASDARRTVIDVSEQHDERGMTGIYANDEASLDAAKANGAVAIAGNGRAQFRPRRGGQAAQFFFLCREGRRIGLMTQKSIDTAQTALLQRLAAVRGRLSLCADQAAAAKWWLSMPMASVSAEGPMPKALSTRRTSPLMPGCRHQGRACPLRRARMTSNPLIVA